MIKLSILEQSALIEHGTAEQSINDTIITAQIADQSKFHRIWLSEHHNLSILQGSTPEVLLASIGAQTKNIRIGSGGVMIGNHSAYHIAENFRMLEALYPGRVDCGIGRASGGDAFSTSLLTSQLPADFDFTDQVSQLDIFLYDECKRAIATPQIKTAPPIWLLSGAGHINSGNLAAKMGLGLAVALFINPQANPLAVDSYIKNFEPSDEFSKPQVIIALNCVCAEDPEKLAELRKTSDFFRLMRDSGNYPKYIPKNESLKDFQIDANQQAYLRRIDNREVAGTPKEVKEQILQKMTDYKATEVMLTFPYYDLNDKRESIIALSKEFNLTS